MVRQRRQPALDSTPPSRATTKLTEPTRTTASSSLRRAMQDESAAELRTLSERDGVDSIAGGYRDVPETSSPASPASPTSRAPPAPALPTKTTWLQRNQWIALSLASGACAAFNGVFAKLTTTELTTRLSQAVASALGLDAAESAVEVVVRGTFFALNLVFNGVVRFPSPRSPSNQYQVPPTHRQQMWTLFTRALARGLSATQVSIMNTSANFVLTALLGFAIFSEALPPLWWVGAAMLVAGNVIIGRKDEGKADAAAAAAATTAEGDADDTDATAISHPDPEPDEGRRRSSRRLAAQRGNASGTKTSPASAPTGRYKDEESSGDEDFAQI
ncbi:uncharacterized protein SPSK_09441 [Sporothrix schenckii 1099-18]|uniref:Uncharacterized protein n=1 Tax=Sporothrix schenckii 1099-18 TaxID=1397361 RepID=A0A0F2M9D3_SPOSC|nr:uncharacterized protein SPSK_09441 [Sporothrix schenckii 1099-18]KJR85689.1 hypothetical protein SPSK_09441 [Sporothrix schenckii 1099-18]